MNDEQINPIDKSGLTAIARKRASVPTRWLHEKGYLDSESWILDYGCGRGKDVEYLREQEHIVTGYDPNHWPVPDEELAIIGKASKYILCQYVLNVVQPDDIEAVIGKVHKLLQDGGIAYFTVRRDIKKEGYTKRGTYQHNVVLNMPVVRETSTYCIYKMEKE